MYILDSTNSQLIIFYRNSNEPFLLAPAKFYICMLYQSPFMVPNVGVGYWLIKNNLRIFLGSRFNIFKNIETRKKLCHSYKKKCVIIILTSFWNKIINLNLTSLLNRIEWKYKQWTLLFTKASEPAASQPK